MKRVIIWLALVLVVFNAECFAACTLEPCGHPAPATAQTEAPCHHQAPTPATEHEDGACTHPQFVSSDDARFALPILESQNFEVAVVTIAAAPSWPPVQEPASADPPPPLQSASLSRAVLRV